MIFKPLNLNQANLKITKTEGVYWVWDVWRKKRVQLTPEEWVRQHLLHDLVKNYHYPGQRISVEMQIIVNQLKRRCDAVVYDASGTPQMIIECKEPDVELNATVVHQIAQYNRLLKTNFLLISNGLSHFTLLLGEGSDDVKVYQGIVPYFEL